MNSKYLKLLGIVVAVFYLVGCGSSSTPTKSSGQENVAETPATVVDPVADPVKDACDSVVTDDGNTCTEDTCVDGVAVHTQITSDPSCVTTETPTPPTTNSCDSVVTADGNACTDDSCVDGVAVHTPVTNDTTCDDGSLCTTGDTCQSGICTAGTAKTCTASDQCHIAGVCDPATGLCSDPSQASGTACTTDSLACTSDTCNGSGTCAHTINAGQCVIGGVCYASGTVNSANACQICDSTKSQTAWSSQSSGTVCRASAGACDNAEVCNGTGAQCPADTFKPASTTCKTAVDQCDKAEMCTGVSVSCPADVKQSNGTTCNDSFLCTKNDICTTGACSGTTYSCTATECQASSSCDGFGGCSTVNKSAGTACTSDSLTCTSDTCNGSGTCAHTINAEQCVIGGVCYASGTVNSANACQICDSTKSQTAWSSQSSGTTCRASAGACDNAEVCNGTGAQCPADTFKPATTTCKTAVDQCDKAEMCTGVSVSCPADVKQPNGTTCNDGNSCTTGDSCQSGICQPTSSCSTLTALWANDGGAKIPQDDTPASEDPVSVINSAWNGTSINIFGAKNEVVSFNLLLEASNVAVSNVSVSFDKLTGPSGALISSAPVSNNDGVFNYVDRNIELFYVRYLEIKGLSEFLVGGFYDERHLPEKFRRPHDAYGIGSGGWADRPDHNKRYPDIAVPIELHNQFDIAEGTSQSIWADIYIPKNAPAGAYAGSVIIKEGAVTVASVPVNLTVRNFALPDEPASKTMLYVGYQDINKRYVDASEAWPYKPADVALSDLVHDRHFQMAHRHKISLIDSDYGNYTDSVDHPRPVWEPRLDGSLFTPANGYDGPGVATGNGIYSIGTYGSWAASWGTTQSAIQTHSNAWVDWFDANSSNTEYFLYLIDESSDYAQMETWANWLNTNPGPGKKLMSMATSSALTAYANIPSLDVPTSNMYVGDTSSWQTAVDNFNSAPDKRAYFYNGGRPGAGSFMTDDDGIALRELAWGQYKKGIDRWFYWESTYYNNYQSDGAGETNVFGQAKTFGKTEKYDAERGDTGWNYANGDGVLFYPGTDLIYPQESYGVKGPIASIRLKEWRRGIQDVDYLEMAAAANPALTAQIMNSVVPKVLWEYGVTDPSDPTWVRANISWSSDPDVWEAARSQLADIIEENVDLP